MNFADQTIQGVRFSWESSDPDKVQIDDTGRALFHRPSRAFITCRAGTVQATVPVLVRPGGWPRQSDQEWRADQEGLPESTKPTGRIGQYRGYNSSLGPSQRHGSYISADRFWRFFFEVQVTFQGGAVRRSEWIWAGGKRLDYLGTLLSITTAPQISLYL